MKPVLTIVIILIVLAIVIAAVVLYRKGTGGAFDPGQLKYFNVAPDQFSLDPELVIKGVSSPTSMAIQKGVFYITSKGGKFYIFSGNNLTKVADLKDMYKLETASEGGLLGVALDPSFDTNNLLYLSYTLKTKDEKGLVLVVSSFALKEGKLSKGDEMVRIPAAEKYHHGGTLRVFDSHLYLSVGDGGPQRDPKRNAQNMKLYLGKMLRINLEKPYKVKIVALGLRNPWSFSINSELGMFVGDVGLSKVESVYLLPNLNPDQPYNLGWNYFEGYNTPLDPSGKKPDDFWPPIFEYPAHENYGRAVIGGFYVPAKKLYIFGDYAGFLRALRFDDSKKLWEQVAENKMDKKAILSFGFDGTTVYFGGRDSIYKVNIKAIT